MVIYEIKNNINDKIYIGKDTVNKKSYYGSGLLVKRAIKKYSKENFTKKIIDTATTYDELSEKEKFWIKEFRKKYDLYNITDGGDGGDTLSNHPKIKEIKIKISESSKTKGKTFEEVYGEELTKQYKNKLKLKLHLSLNSESADLSRKKYWETHWKTYEEKCVEIKNRLKFDNFELLKEDLIKLYKTVGNKNNVMNFKKVKDFYDYFNDKRVDEFFNKKNKNKKICANCKIEFEYKNKHNIYCSKKCVIRKNNPNYICSHNKPISIDNINYNSITEASKELNLERSLIRYRLKSENFKNYIFL
jgi:hypothetical protein